MATDDQGRQDKLEICTFEQRAAALVILVVGIGDRVQRAGVNDREHPTHPRASAR